MRVATVGNYALTLGWVIALVVLVLAIVLVATGQLGVMEGGLIAALAVARMT